MTTTIHTRPEWATSGDENWHSRDMGTVGRNSVSIDQEVVGAERPITDGSVYITVWDNERLDGHTAASARRLASVILKAADEVDRINGVTTSLEVVPGLKIEVPAEALRGLSDDDLEEVRAAGASAAVEMYAKLRGLTGGSEQDLEA